MKIFKFAHYTILKIQFVLACRDLKHCQGEHPRALEVPARTMDSKKLHVKFPVFDGV